ncbi:MAG: LPS export ABC transporter permease LptF [Thermodesulfobacteriota bacterium]
MPQILYRYLVLEILPPFGVSLLGFTAIVFLGRMMKVTQMIVVKGVGLIDVLKTCVFLLPYLLVFTLPMAATVGILLAMTRLSVDQEMTAMKTAGLSYSQLLPPVMGFSLAVGMLTLGLTMLASPWGQAATKDLLKDVVKRRADLGIKEQTFNTDFNGMMLFVNQVAPKGGHLEGIFVYDFRDSENPLTIYAENGDLSYNREKETMLMQLYDGRVIRWGQESNRWQTLEFKTYQLPLDLFSFTLKGAKSETEMSLGELWGIIAKEPRGSDPSNRALVELNQRFALPVGAVLLCFMAMPLGLSPVRHGRTWGLVLGLVVFLVYYVIFTASWRLAVNARINPALAPWLSNFLFVWVAVYLWYRTVRELPLLPARLRLRGWRRLSAGK